jgi:flagellar biosynthesis protein FlhG
LNAFERQLDWLVVDASRGASSTVQSLIEAADDLLIVTVPEPVAVAEAYATVKSFAKSRTPRLGLLVNQAESAGQANQILDCLQQAAHSFLQVDLHRRGFIPRDIAVSKSVLDRIPFALGAPESEATLALDQLAKRWTKTQSGNEKSSFFGRLWKTCVSGTSIHDEAG